MLTVCDGLGGIGEEAGAFDHYVHAFRVPADVGGVLFGEDGDFLAVDDDILVFSDDITALVGAVVAVVLEQVGVGLGVRQVVKRNDLNFAVGEALLDGAVGDASDAAKAVDANSHCHDGWFS